MVYKKKKRGRGFFGNSPAHKYAADVRWGNVKKKKKSKK